MTPASITQNELLYLYSQSQDQYKRYAGENLIEQAMYYKGRMDMASHMLRSLYPGWERVGTIGYYIYHKEMNYAHAENMVQTGTIQC